MQFIRAEKRRAKLRLALAGGAGHGKSYSALAVGTALTNDGRVAVIDTEAGSASKYADIFDFDVVELAPPFHPRRFVELIHTAAEGGYDVLVIDSLSHAWNGEGGLLELVDQIATRMKTPNSFAAWAEATPIQNALIEAILRAPLHVIACMRSKQQYVIEQIERGGRTTNVPRKVGLAPIQRDAVEYEFDVFGELDPDNNLIISKTRYAALQGAVIPKPGRELAEQLRQWLEDGREVEPEDGRNPFVRSEPGAEAAESPEISERSAAPAASAPLTEPTATLPFTGRRGNGADPATARQLAYLKTLSARTRLPEELKGELALALDAGLTKPAASAWIERLHEVA